MEATSDLVGFTDPAGRTRYVNGAGRRLLGLSESEDVRGRLFTDFHPPWAVEQLRAVGIPAALRTGLWSGESALRNCAGQDIPVTQVLVAHKASDGSVNFLSTIIRDATELKRAEQVAQQSRQQAEDLVQSIDGIVWEVDAQTFRFSFVSAQAERLLGYPGHQWLADPAFWAAHIHPEDRDRAVNNCVECTAKNQSHQFEYRMIARDGRVVWLRDLVAVEVENGRAVRLRGVMFDITERKRVEEELRASEERKRAMLDASLDCIITMDEEGRILEFNPAAEKTFERRRDEVVGEMLAEIIVPPGQGKRTSAAWRITVPPEKDRSLVAGSNCRRCGRTARNSRWRSRSFPPAPTPGRFCSRPICATSASGKTPRRRAPN